MTTHCLMTSGFAIVQLIFSGKLLPAAVTVKVSPESTFPLNISRSVVETPVHVTTAGPSVRVEESLHCESPLCRLPLAVHELAR
jgi:hypothetical protein